MRTTCWCKLESDEPRFVVHFGYDYYVYLVADIELESAIAVAAKAGLRMEEFLSPYLEVADGRLKSDALVEADWARIAVDLRTLLSVYAERMPLDSVEAVEHYVNHDEHEMAFEILCLDLIKLGVLSREDIEACKLIALELGMDEETVFDVDFWKDLSAS